MCSCVKQPYSLVITRTVISSLTKVSMSSVRYTRIALVVLTLWGVSGGAQQQVAKLPPHVSSVNRVVPALDCLGGHNNLLMAAQRWNAATPVLVTSWA